MPSPPVFELDHWRIRSDTETPEGGTPVWETTEDQSTALSWSLDTTFRVTLIISNASGNNTNNATLDLQYSVNSGTWTRIGNASTTVEGVIYHADASVAASGSAVSEENYLLSAGTGTAVVGRYLEGASNNYDLPDDGDYVENSFGITFPTGNTNSVAAGDTVEFRHFHINESAASTNNATIPTITIAGGVLSIPVMYYHHKHHNLAG